MRTFLSTVNFICYAVFSTSVIGGIRADLVFVFAGVFGNELPFELAGAVFEQFVNRGADGSFVFDAKLGKFGERIVIDAIGLVVGLRVRLGMGRFYTKTAGSAMLSW